jgi:hypothetical protein
MSGRTLITQTKSLQKLEKDYDYRTKDKPDCILLPSFKFTLAQSYSIILRCNPNKSEGKAGK